MNHNKFQHIHEQILNAENENGDEEYFPPKKGITFSGFLKFTGITIASSYLCIKNNF